MGRLALCLPPFSVFGQFPIPLGNHGLPPSFQLVLRAEVTDGTTQSHFVVIGHILGHDPLAIALQNEAQTFVHVRTGYRVDVAVGRDLNRAQVADDIGPNPARENLSRSSRRTSMVCTTPTTTRASSAL